MESHVFQTKIRKRGCLELKNLPFKEGTAIEISISLSRKVRLLKYQYQGRREKRICRI